MFAFVGTVLSDPRSVAVAERCVRSARSYGIEAVVFPATERHEVRDRIAALPEAELLFPISKWDQSFSDPEAVLANFYTQYSIWHVIAGLSFPAFVLEHDAVFIRKPPVFACSNNVISEIVNIAKPSFGSFREKEGGFPGVYSFFSKDYGNGKKHFGGAHGYCMTPKGALQAIAVAKKVGGGPCDLFFSVENFPMLGELVPWCVEARDTFSLIQKKKGCLAKHNYGPEYKYLEG